MWRRLKPPPTLLYVGVSYYFVLIVFWASYGIYLYNIYIYIHIVYIYNIYGSKYTSCLNISFFEV